LSHDSYFVQNVLTLSVIISLIVRRRKFVFLARMLDSQNSQHYIFNYELSVSPLQSNAVHIISLIGSSFPSGTSNADSIIAHRLVVVIRRSCYLKYSDNN